jgi:hypothetical protein
LRQRHDEAELERFRSEVQLASSFDHLYAAHIYTFGSKDGFGWYAARRARWVRRLLAVSAATIVLSGVGWFLYRGAMQARMDARLAQEQARSAR